MKRDTMSETPTLQIIITSGPEDAARAAFGFAAAAAACCSGESVVLFLALTGARWALQSEGNKPHMPGSQPIGQLLDVIRSSGGRIEVCSNCLQGQCALPGTEQAALMRPGVATGGLASVAMRMSQIPTVTF